MDDLENWLMDPKKNKVEVWNESQDEEESAITEEPTMEEVEKALERIANENTTGMYRINGELIKYGGIALKESLGTLIAKI